MTLSTIIDMFARSPFRPLQQHMGIVHQCAQSLETFIEALEDGSWDVAEQRFQEISGLEAHADDLKKELRLHLPKSIMLPVSRGDVLELLTVQDEIANLAEDIAGLMIGRRMQLPKEITPIFKMFLRSSIETTRQAQQAIAEVDELHEVGFRGREVQLIKDMIVQLNELESESDRKQIEIRQALFQLEDKLPPVHVIFLYKIIDWIGELADTAQRVGGRIQLLLAK